MNPMTKALFASFASILVLAGASGSAAGQTSLARLAGVAAVQPPAEQPKKDDVKKEEPKKEDKPATPPQEKPVAQFEYVKMSTSKGDIYLELDHGKAPISTENFLRYVDKKFYDGTVFHRVVPDFVVQGGGFDKDLKKKETAAPIKNEWQNGLKNKRGTVAMARTSAPDSATSQFYINLKDNAPLDDGSRTGAAYAVFGKVVNGMDVVDKIAQAKTTTKTADRQPFENCPVEPITINSVTRVTKDEAEKKK